MSDPTAALKANPELLKNPVVQEQLRKLVEIKDSNPLANYFPHSKQRPFHKGVATLPSLGTGAYFGGNQSGKSYGTIADDVIQAVPKDLVPKHLLPYKRWNPPFHCWIACPKFQKLQENILPTLRKLIPRSELKDGSFDRSYSNQDKLLKLNCGSTFGFKTYEMDVDAYSAATIHRMHWDEEPEGDHGKAIRQEARARLLKFGGQEIFSMTPLFGYSFVFEEIMEPWERGEREGLFVIVADMDDNPYLDEKAKNAFLAILTDEEREARKEGRFVHFKGLVYPEFEDAHVVDPPSKQHIQGQEIVVGIDPGYRTTAVAFLAFDKDNTAVVFDELYLHKDDALPESTAEQIRLINSKWGIDPQWFYIDPVARNASLQTGSDNIQSAYFRANIPVVEANNKVEAGILEVKRRLQASPPALLVSKECRNWLQERGRYRLDDREDGKFEVVKANDHLMDATRYACMARTWWQGEAPGKPKLPTYGERPDFEPPASEQHFIEQVPPLGAYT